MPRTTPPAVTRAAETIGEQLGVWRRLLSLTAEQTVERAGIARSTLGKIESGHGDVSFTSILKVARALGVLDALVLATDPYETDLGRARADQTLPRRVRS